MGWQQRKNTIGVKVCQVVPWMEAVASSSAAQPQREEAPQAGLTAPPLSPHIARGPLVDVHIVSFGTRTLAQCWAEPSAQKLREQMWPRHRSYLGPDAFNSELATAALRNICPRADGMAWDVVLFVKCTSLHGRDYGHIGSYGLTMREYSESRGFDEVIREVARCFPLAQPRTLIATWCNAGEHRSVAIAEFVRAFLSMHVPCNVTHLCRSLWGRRGCDCCNECDPMQLDGHRDRAYGDVNKRLTAVVVNRGVVHF